MKVPAFSLLIVTALVASGCGQQAGTGSTKLASQEDSVSYILGLQDGRESQAAVGTGEPGDHLGGMQAGFKGTPAPMLTAPCRR